MIGYCSVFRRTGSTRNRKLSPSGGTSFMGGKGKILGVVIGGMIIGIINYGMTALMIPSSYQKIVMGALIIISVAIDHFVAKAKN